MTIEELRDYVEILHSQDEISYDVYSGLIDGIDTLEQETCEDCISRENTLKAIIEQLGIRNENYLIPSEETLYKVVKSMPSVNLHPKTGQWINNQNGTFECDQCGCKHSKSRFCPDCGAKMREVEDGNK